MRFKQKLLTDGAGIAEGSPLYGAAGIAERRLSAMMKGCLRKQKQATFSHFPRRSNQDALLNPYNFLKDAFNSC